MHIISVGKNVYTNDERFHVLNFENSDDWVLQIKYVQKRDNGSYECSVSNYSQLNPPLQISMKLIFANSPAGAC